MFQIGSAKPVHAISMRQTALDVLALLPGGLRRLLRIVPFVVGLAIAGLFLGGSASDAEILADPDTQEAAGSEPIESDSYESPELLDDINADLLTVLAPGSVRAVPLFAQIGGARNGFGSPLPRPSGV